VSKLTAARAENRFFRRPACVLWEELPNTASLAAKVAACKNRMFFPHASQMIVERSPWTLEYGFTAGMACPSLRAAESFHKNNTLIPLRRMQ
jgi:hypothetical protein